MNDTTELRKQIIEVLFEVANGVSESAIMDSKANTGVLDKALDQIMQLVSQAIDEARREELEMALHHLFQLRTSVPRLQASPPQIGRYLEQRIAQLTPNKDNQ